MGDAGYALSWKVLTPYRGVRYHLREWALGNRRPQNAKELFNLRHSSLRNAIERIFGVIKKRFPILVEMSPYTFPFQTDLVLCQHRYEGDRVNAKQSRFVHDFQLISM